MYRARIRREDLDRGWLSATTSVSVFYLRRNGWLVYASAILFISILMTHSRGGLLVTMVSLAVLAGCATRNALNRKFALISIVILAVCAALLFGLVGGATVERFSRIDTASLERYEIFELTIKAIGDHPILGTGLGTFSDIFAAYRTETLLPQIDFAHNSFGPVYLLCPQPCRKPAFSSVSGPCDLHHGARVLSFVIRLPGSIPGRRHHIRRHTGDSCRTVILCHDRRHPLYRDGQTPDLIICRHPVQSAPQHRCRRLAQPMQLNDGMSIARASRLAKRAPESSGDIL